MYDELVMNLRDLSNWSDIAWREYAESGKQLIKQAADAIEELSRKTRELPRWIPMTERLPEKNGSYLVYAYGEVTEMNCWHGIWHRLGDNYTKAVTHWMPLPQTPKEET